MLVEEGNFQHIDFAHHSIFGLEVAGADRMQRKIDMRGPAPPERKTAEETVLCHPS
jgi:hypothetical protein